MTREYYLIMKNYGQSFVKYKGDVIRLSRQLPYTVDEVVVGVKGKIGQEKRITTFKDSQGNILERIFDYFGKPLKNQVYTRQEFTKGDDLYITSTTIKEYSINRQLINYYKSLREEFEKADALTAFWNKIKIENNHLCENINSGEKIFSRTSVTNIKHPTQQIHSFIEYPHIINGKRRNDSKKVLQIKVNSKKGLTTETLIQQGVQKPEKDSFLAFRALDFGEIKEAISEFFIRKRGLSKMDIGIVPEYQPKGDAIDKLSAEFDYSNGNIHFNRFYKFKSKSQLVSTSRHEVEHGWQYYLDARNRDCYDSPWWQMEMAAKFGKLKNKKLQQEAQKYTESVENYVPYFEDFEKYKQNYIEIKANEAGQFARNNYEKEAQEIQNSFPFIPEEML